MKRKLIFIIILFSCLLLSFILYINKNELESKYKFKEIEKNKILNIIKNQTCIVYIGSPKNNKDIIKYIYELSEKYEINVYYSRNYDLEVKKYLLKIDKNSNEDNYDPIIIFIKNGDIIDYYYGDLINDKTIKDDFKNSTLRILPDVCENKNSC